MGQRAKVGAATVLAGALLAGSGCDATTSGSAAPATTADAAAATEALWDPCTQISDDVLRQVRVDPATRDNTISGVANVEGWKLCSWHNKASRWDYTLGVWSTTYTVEELRKDANNVEFKDVSVTGRSGVQFRKAHDSHDSVCYLGFPFSNGTIEISVFNSAASDLGQDPCRTASAAADVLVAQLPK
ncbi:hypothetical protein GCM10011588_48570 [Nocardia jinanensis]|uniref:DUF3558 domain-containing protein n=1 Tax=Nocardia jinanensis TaxID=382504 RepID=A0A917VVZ4_9NOCA|nr:hypothetical protein GCM10011588_48570 [Nocardia jinanensis]